MKDTYQSMLTKPEIQFWVPIIVYITALCASYFGLKSDIRALTAEIKYHDERTAIFENKVNNLQAAVNTVEKDIITIKAKGGAL